MLRRPVCAARPIRPVGSSASDLISGETLMLDSGYTAA